MVLLLTPIVLYAAAVAIFAVNVPFGDDYDAALNFLNHWSGNLAGLFEQHNEHRLVFNRCVVVAVAFFAGSIDFRWLIAIGNIGLIGLFVVVCRLHTEQRGKIMVALPVALLMFSFQNWENMTWALASLQNYYGALFSVLALCLLPKQSSRLFVCGLAFATMASFTMGNGMLVFPVAAAWYVWRLAAAVRGPQSMRPSLARLATIGAVAAAVAVVYAYRYVPPPQHPGVCEDLRRPGRIVAYFLAFLGSYTVFRPAAILTGAAICVLFAIMLRRRRWQTNPETYLILLYVLGSAALAAITRSGFGIEQAVTSRYRILALLALCLLWKEAYSLDFCGVQSRRLLLPAVVVASALIFVTSLFYVGSLAKRHDELVFGMEGFRHGNITGLRHSSPAHAAAVLRQSIEMGHYKFDP